MRTGEEIPNRVLESILALAQFLVVEARIVERRGSGARESKDMVPYDKVKDASALARELRWRCRNALGDESDDERQKKSDYVNGSNKRKRNADDSDDGAADNHVDGFRHFKPRRWDKIHQSSSTHASLQQKVVKTLSLSDWLEWNLVEKTAKDEEVTAKVNTSDSTIVRIRKYTNGNLVFVERSKAHQTQEVWQWEDSDT